MEMICPKCQTPFEPDKGQEDLITRSQAKGMTFIAIMCPSCHRVSGYNPQGGAPPSPPPASPLRCPVQRCVGFVSFVDDNPPFWGCGACGAIWHDEANLHGEITSIVERFPHRRRSYAKKGRQWRAAKREPKGYSEGVLKEPMAKTRSFVRG